MHLRMKCITTALLYASAILVLPELAHAQRAEAPPAGVGPCGPLAPAEREFSLEHYSPVFTSTEGDDAEFRAEMGLELVSADDPVEVVSDPRDCGRIVAKAFGVLNEQIGPGGTPATFANMEWAVLRIGPYYVIPMNSRSVEGITVQQFGQILIFRAEDLSFVDRFLG